MSGIQLSFSLKVSSGVKTVHLLGSWDNYVGQLPLSKDKSSSKSGVWKGTFRFHGTTLVSGQRYWYYYIIDGYHASHDPSVPSTVEPTTGRELNILDAPKAKSSSSSHSSRSSKSHSGSKEKSSKRLSVDIPKGRPLSVSKIESPRPFNPGATRKIIDAAFDEDYEELSHRFASTDLYEDEVDYVTNEYVANEYVANGYIANNYDTPAQSSPDSQLSYRSDSESTGSSVSGYSTPNSDCSSCTCERYGITRKGERVRLDCGGTRCGYDSESSCSSSEDEAVSGSARRNGIVVRE
jgi:hypothetical protein